MTLRSVEGCCKRLMLANVLQLISFLSVLFAATIAVFLGVYRYYITLIFWTAIALALNATMLLCAHSIKKRLPTTPFAINLQQSRPDEIVQALEVKQSSPMFTVIFAGVAEQTFGFSSCWRTDQKDRTERSAPMPKHAELHEIRRYRAALRMLGEALQIEH